MIMMQAVVDQQPARATGPTRGGRGRGRGRSRGRGRGRARSEGEASGLPVVDSGEKASIDSQSDQQTNESISLHTGISNIQKQPETRGRPNQISQRGRGRGRGKGRNNGRGHETSTRGDALLPAGKQTDTNSSTEPIHTSKQVKKEHSTDPTKQIKPKKQQSNPKNNKSKGKQDVNKTTNQQQPSLAPSVPPNQCQQTSDINYGRDDTITVLHIAEKPSIAQAIAQGLSSGNATYRSKSLPVHEFTNPPFPKAPRAHRCHHRVTSVVGHVFSIDFPPQFQSWDSVDPAELFAAPIQRKPCKSSVVKHLQDEARNVDFLVLWMDCDREGENINFEVLGCVLHLMKASAFDGGNPYDRVYRAHFSAINTSDIQTAYQTLGKPDKYQASSVDARQELDLKVGVAFSRFQTRFFQGRYGDLDSAVLSYGPCQTPTLGFVVQRYIDIETFKPEPYWVLELGINKRGRNLKALWGTARSFNKNRVDVLLQKAVEMSSSVQVTAVESKEKKQGRPVPMNTVALLKACSKALGIGPHAALQTAERLYLQGYLSYPRTESSAYPASFDIAAALREQQTDNRWGSYVRKLLAGGGHNKSKGGVDMGDHPPITPCRSARAGELSGDMARVYDLVVRHFIASVSNDAIWMSTRVDFGIEALNDKGTFVLRGKQIVDPGFLEILMHKEYGDEKQSGDEDNDEEDREIPYFQVGETIPLANCSNAAATSNSKVAVSMGEMVHANLSVKEKITTPPFYLTESELITLMERNGIGTDASTSHRVLY
jgi:DNA topoisomerase-3